LILLRFCAIADHGRTAEFRLFLRRPVAIPVAIFAAL
jgi:hypothetical protein